VYYAARGGGGLAELAGVVFGRRSCRRSAVPDRPHAAVAAALSCPKQRTPDEIVVCGDSEVNRRYRTGSAHISDYGTRASQNTSRERNALLDFDAGGNGTCSTVGPWGAWGCFNKRVKADQQQSAGSTIKGGVLYKPDY